MQHRLIEWKTPLCKFSTSWMALWLICCFVVILLYIERKWPFKGNLATMLPLKSKFSGKFQRFDATNESIQMKISENEKF